MTFNLLPCNISWLIYADYVMVMVMVTVIVVVMVMALVMVAAPVKMHQVNGNEL